MTYSHFEDKDAIGHVVDAQAKGMITAAEIHGIETPGHIAAGADAARDTGVLLLLLNQAPYLPFFLIGWAVWRIGRAAWLGWARLERLHRVLAQEKWEIEHNRPQERDELRELYRAKGFEGKLLEDVLDVLMADGDRLLRVMVEEELGLSLQNVEHPLKQGLGAGIGVGLAALAALPALYYSSAWGLALSSLLVIGLSALILAKFAQNRLIPAVVWNLALALFAFALSYYTYQLLA